MYVELVPTYRYDMPCGASFRTQVQSVPDEDGYHWFPCLACGKDHDIHKKELTYKVPPRKADTMDRAIVKDRIASDIKANWCATPPDVLAERHKVSLRTVYYVASDIGVRCWQTD